MLWFSELPNLKKMMKGEWNPNEDEMRKTLVSPFCAEIFYCYYGDEDAGPDDIKEWEIQNCFRKVTKIMIHTAYLLS